MARESSPELLEGFEILKDGKWLLARKLLTGMGVRIAPGPAERWIRQHLTDPDGFSRNELVEMGRRRMCQERAAGMLRRGRWEADCSDLTRERWTAGDFHIRDRFPGHILMVEALAQLDAPRHVVMNWIESGVAPPPTSVTGQPRAEKLVSPATLQVWKVMVANRPGPYRRDWDPHPHVYWKAPKDTLACPHCGARLVVTTQVSAPLTEIETDEQ